MAPQQLPARSDFGMVAIPRRSIRPSVLEPVCRAITQPKPSILFIEELTLDHIAGAWRFGSREYTLPDGQSTVLNNRGGETHTFTRVDNFGGGFVPLLNELSGNRTPAPECLQSPSDTFIFVPGLQNVSGPTAGSSAIPAGVSRFQCCIHPWMRTTIVVKGDGMVSTHHP